MSSKRRSSEEFSPETGRLTKQIAVLRSEARKLKRSEEALKLDEARLEALLRLSQLSEASEQDIANFALEECIAQTGSEIGWMGALDHQKGLVNLYNYSSRTMEECRVKGMPLSYVIEKGGLWAEPIRKRKPIITNDYSASNEAKKGLPEGHLQLKKLLAAPVFDGDRVVALIVVGNKNGDYNQSDIRQLTLLMDGVWRIILRKRTEKALQDSKKQAELYLDLMSHDLNNVNQAVLGFLELALQEFDNGSLQQDEKRALLEMPIEAIHSSTKLIGNVKKLQSARKGGLQEQLFDLDALLREAIGEYAVVPGRTVKIDYTPEKGHFIIANELVRDVFSNLVGNSIKHSPADRPLEIRIRINSVVEQEKKYNAVLIEDNGPGIRDEKKCLLFDRYSTKPDRRLKGGLGLELVNMLVSDFGGRVWVEDRIAGDHSKGSRFGVMLPAIEKT